MKKIISYSFIIAASMATISLHGQTADDIVSKSIDAIGGKDVISKITSLTMTGTVQAFGNDNPTTITILGGKGYKSETQFNGQKSVQCISDKGGWYIDPRGGGGAQPMPDDAYKSAKSQLDIGGPLVDYAAKGSTIELLGKDKKNYKIKLTTQDKSVITFYIDASTYYISKVVKQGSVMGQQTEITTEFSDYKKTDAGLVVPYSVNTDLGQFQLATTFKTIDVNKTIDPVIFNMPK